VFKLRSIVCAVAFAGTVLVASRPAKLSLVLPGSSDSRCTSLPTPSRLFTVVTGPGTPFCTSETDTSAWFDDTISGTTWPCSASWKTTSNGPPGLPFTSILPASSGIWFK
jgi:hypothetical protein